MKTSLKTTLAGIGSILAALGTAATQYSQGGFAAVQIGVLIPAIIVGVGLIFAKDYNITGTPNL